MDAKTLNDIVDVFKCCIFTWGIFTTMLPAFVLAGAIAAFVPADKILRYMGARANKFVAYGVASVSGILLALCSCNIVPLFVSIYRRGAGIGPASTFLFAGPAINVLSMMFVFQVVGPALGLWRAIGVPLMAVIIGASMAIIWGRKEKEREAKAAQLEAMVGLEGPKYLPAVFLLLLGIMICGSLELLPWVKGVLLGGGALAAVVLVWRGFERDHLVEWRRETWGLVKMIIPVLVPVVLVIGAIAHFTSSLLIDDYLGYQNPYATVNGAVFGSLMYFPILTEVAFTKAFLKVFQIDTGPAMAILLTGAGLSLPGMILIAREWGIARTLTYVLILIGLAIGAGYLFSHFVGTYTCTCYY